MARVDGVECVEDEVLVGVDGVELREADGAEVQKRGRALFVQLLQPHVLVFRLLTQYHALQLLLQLRHRRVRPFQRVQTLPYLCELLFAVYEAVFVDFDESAFGEELVFDGEDEVGE